MKVIIKAAAAVMAAVMLTGCSASEPKPTVTLSVWWSDEGDRELINAEIEKFKEMYADEAEFGITVSTESVLTVRDTVLARPEAAADVYMFADDQFEVLRGAVRCARSRKTPMISLPRTAALTAELAAPRHTTANFTAIP